MRSIPATELVLDLSIYPRREVDALHVGSLRNAIRAGVTLPPLVICLKSRRIVDGFHRRDAYVKERGPSCEVEVVEREYASENELFLDAMRLNAGHGLRLNLEDKEHATKIASRLGIAPECIATALSVPVPHVMRLKSVPAGGQLLPAAKPKPASLLEKIVEAGSSDERKRGLRQVEVQRVNGRVPLAELPGEGNDELCLLPGDLQEAADVFLMALSDYAHPVNKRVQRILEQVDNAIVELIYGKE